MQRNTLLVIVIALILTNMYDVSQPLYDLYMIWSMLILA